MIKNLVINMIIEKIDNISTSSFYFISETKLKVSENLQDKMISIVKQLREKNFTQYQVAT